MRKGRGGELPFAKTHEKRGFVDIAAILLHDLLQVRHEGRVVLAAVGHFELSGQITTILREQGRDRARKFKKRNR